jgi:hypothetical protein
LFYHDAPRIVAARFDHIGVVLINRRLTLGLLATVAVAPRALANVAPQRSEIRDSLAKRFTDAGTVGTFVGYKTDDYLIIASDKDRSGQAFLPASTFKIPNSLIALETGVVGDPDKDIFKWDGVKRSIEAWNQDHTLRSAIAASAVPVYQEIARHIGAERMQKYVDLFEYGNRNIGGGIDQFWLTGEIAPRRPSGLQAQSGSGPRHPPSDHGRRCHDPRKIRTAWRRTRQAVTRLAGRLGREGRRADRVRAQPRCSRAPPCRRSHEAGAAVPDRYRRDLIRHR